MDNSLLVMTKALVITGFGINCEEELAAAFRLAGGTADIAHVNEVFEGDFSIQEYDVLSFPGGFSFGDDLGSGKVMANKIKYKLLPNKNTLLQELKIFLDNGNFVLGICNGFQFLVRLGLVPNVGLKFEQEATLAQNDSGLFEDRWVYCKVNPESNSPFLEGIDVLPLPVRHGEGKLIIKKELEEEVLKKNLQVLTYCDEAGGPTSQYPFNPNGSAHQIAGLSDTTGQILGLMPHPEAFLSLYNHPNWAAMKSNNPNLEEEGLGLKIFKNIVNHISKKHLKKAASWVS